MNPYLVEDPEDPLIADFLRLDDHKLRQERELPNGDMAGFFLAEGDQVIERALATGHKLSTLIVDANRRKPLPASIPEMTKILLCKESALVAISGRSSLKDPIGSFIRPPPLFLEDALQLSKTIVVTESITNPTNMGALFRNAAALDADLVCVDSTSCDPLYRRAVRVSMGQVFSIKHVRADHINDLFERLNSSGFTCFALTLESDAEDISNLKLEEETQVAMFVGAEGSGLTKATVDKCDHKIRIPMNQNVDSLNVGTALAVALYVTREKRRSGL